MRTLFLPTCAGWGRIVPLMAAGRLFDYDRPLAASLAEKQEKLKAEINSEGEDYFTGVNQEAWVAYLVARYRIAPPFLERDEPLLEDFGERDVDATGMPGCPSHRANGGRPSLVLGVVGD